MVERRITEAKVIFSVEIPQSKSPRPNLPLVPRILSEFLLRVGFRYVPDVVKYAANFSKHYETMLQRSGDSILPPPFQHGTKAGIGSPEVFCPDGLYPVGGATRVR